LSLSRRSREKEGGKTELSLTYALGGYLPGGADKLAPVVDGVLGQQVGRLKSLVETGSPAAPKG